MDTKFLKNRDVDMDTKFLKNRDMDMDTRWHRCPPTSDCDSEFILVCTTGQAMSE